MGGACPRVPGEGASTWGRGWATFVLSPDQTRTRAEPTVPPDNKLCAAHWHLTLTLGHRHRLATDQGTSAVLSWGRRWKRASQRPIRSSRTQPVPTQPCLWTALQTEYDVMWWMRWMRRDAMRLYCATLGWRFAWGHKCLLVKS